MSSLVSQNSWVQILIEFDPTRLHDLKLSGSKLCLFQGLFGSNPNNSHLCFGSSIDLKTLTSNRLNILVDQWPFWVVAYADRGSFPSDFPSSLNDFILLGAESVKQGLIKNFFEVNFQGGNSPQINGGELKTQANDWKDEYTLGLANKSSNSFYIGLGRAFQWSENNDDVNYPHWNDMIGCNCFVKLDSQEVQFWDFSNELILFLSTESFKNGTVVPEHLAGYTPCYFNLKAQQTIRLSYNDKGWENKSTDKEDFGVINESPITNKTLSKYLINSSEMSAKKPAVLQYGDKFYLCDSTKKEYIIAARHESLSGIGLPPQYYYPYVSISEMPIKLLLSGGNGNLQDGDAVKIETTEPSVGNENVLGAWTTPSLYYEKDVWGDKQQWTIRKKNNDDPTIHYGDEVYFVNKYWRNQWLCIKDSGSYLTTKENAGVYWWIDEP